MSYTFWSIHKRASVDSDKGQISLESLPVPLFPVFLHLRYLSLTLLSVSLYLYVYVCGNTNFWWCIKNNCWLLMFKFTSQMCIFLTNSTKWQCSHGQWKLETVAQPPLANVSIPSRPVCWLQAHSHQCYNFSQPGIGEKKENECNFWLRSDFCNRRALHLNQRNRPQR